MPRPRLVGFTAEIERRSTTRAPVEATAERSAAFTPLGGLSGEDGLHQAADAADRLVGVVNHRGRAAVAPNDTRRLAVRRAGR